MHAAKVFIWQLYDFIKICQMITENFILIVGWFKRQTARCVQACFYVLG